MVCLPLKSERGVLNNEVVLVSSALCSPNTSHFYTVVVSVKMVRK